MNPSAHLLPAAAVDPPVRLVAKGLSKRFGGVQALRAVDLTLHAGEVHALMGENGAGKSTLLKILTGVHASDSGEIRLDGDVVRPRDPRDAHALGIAVIHQELNQVPEMSVFENFFLGRERRRAFAWLDRRAMRELTSRSLQALGLDIDVDRPLRELRLAERQLLEIAKAISVDAGVLLMDEPTTALTDDEVHRLFDAINLLRLRGVAIVYISHRIEEVLEIADRITVLRDGCWIATRAAAEHTRQSLIEQMVGRSLPEWQAAGPLSLGAEVLRVRALHAPPRPGRQALLGVDLVVHAGEVLGLAGLLGAGRTELLEAIFGVRPQRELAGEILLAGQRCNFRSPRDAIAAGVGFVAEDRKVQSLAMQWSVAENITLAGLGRYVSAGIIDLSRESDGVDAAVRALRIKAPDTRQAVSTLSGGNQQKVVFARNWLMRPRLFLLDEPTQGVDVGAKAEIYALVRQLAEQGAAVLLASSDMPELLALCDRIAVMHQGRVAGELPRAQVTQQRILELASGQSQRGHAAGAELEGTHP
jgi:ribose transport system ATP-binding protein